MEAVVDEARAVPALHELAGDHPPLLMDALALFLLYIVGGFDSSQLWRTHPVGQSTESPYTSHIHVQAHICVQT